MIVFDTKDLVIAQLTADDRVLDSKGNTAGAYDDKASVVTVQGIAVPLADVAYAGSLRAIDLSLPYGTFHITIAEDGTIAADGKRFGRMDGFVSSDVGVRRTEALMVAVTILPVAKGADAGIPDSVEDPEPPPPPPPHHLR